MRQVTRKVKRREIAWFVRHDHNCKNNKENAFKNKNIHQNDKLKELKYSKLRKF